MAHIRIHAVDYLPFVPSNTWIAVGWWQRADISLPIAYVTSEPYIGHLGLGGVGIARLADKLKS